MIKIAADSLPIYYQLPNSLIENEAISHEKPPSAPSTEAQIPAQQSIFPVQSPCQRKCHTNKRGYCTTCYRSRDERFQWLQLSETEKTAVLAQCKKRRKAVEKRLEKIREEKQQQIITQAQLFSETGEANFAFSTQKTSPSAAPETTTKQLSLPF